MTNRIDEGILIAAWHTSKPAYVLAKEFHCSESTLYHTWVRLQTAGKLPQRRRNHVRTRAGGARKAGLTVTGQEYLGSNRKVYEEPSAEEKLRKKATKEFLSLLSNAHPEGPRFDIAKELLLHAARNKRPAWAVTSNMSWASI